jgi:hypothetical protein
MLTLLGVEWYPEPSEQPTDRTSLQEYDVPADVLARWQQTRRDYLQPRAALLREVDRQGFRAPPRPRVGHVDIVMTGPPDAADPPRFVEVEDEQGRSVRFGEWVERGDGEWVLRVPSA